MSKNAMIWSQIESIAPHARRVLLYGPPGTGKSYLARTAGLLKNQCVHPAIIHSDLPAAELRGHYVPNVDGGLTWADGPGIAAWRDGGRLVLDEIDKAGDDTLSFLLALLDDAPTASIELATTKEIIKPHINFQVWGTMNGEPEDLPAALIDRFPVAVRIKAPHPTAMAQIRQDLRGMAGDPAVKDRKRPLGIRAFMEFQKLADSGIGEETAGMVCFGEAWDTIKEGMRLAKAADQR